MTRLLLVSLVIIFAVNFVALRESWYWSYRWLDTVMHIAGGAWLALLFCYLAGERFRLFDLRRNFLITLVAALAFVAFVGVFWEFYEYFHDTVIAKLPPGTPRPHPDIYADTLKDFANDFIGGALAVVIWFL